MRSSDTRRVILLSTLLVFVLIGAFYFDKEIVSLFLFMRNGFLNGFFMGIEVISSLFIVLIFVTALFIYKNKKRWLIPLWTTLALDVILGFLLKVTIQRARPFEVGLIPLIDGLEKASHSL